MPVHAPLPPAGTAAARRALAFLADPLPELFAALAGAEATSSAVALPAAARDLLDAAPFGALPDQAMPEAELLDAEGTAAGYSPAGDAHGARPGATGGAPSSSAGFHPAGPDPAIEPAANALNRPPPGRQRAEPRRITGRALADNRPLPRGQRPEATRWAPAEPAGHEPWAPGEPRGSQIGKGPAVQAPPAGDVLPVGTPGAQAGAGPGRQSGPVFRLAGSGPPAEMQRRVSAGHVPPLAAARPGPPGQTAAARIQRQVPPAGGQDIVSAPTRPEPGARPGEFGRGGSPLQVTPATLAAGDQAATAIRPAALQAAPQPAAAPPGAPWPEALAEIGHLAEEILARQPRLGAGPRTAVPSPPARLASGASAAGGATDTAPASLLTQDKGAPSPHLDAALPSGEGGLARLAALWGAGPSPGPREARIGVERPAGATSGIEGGEGPPPPASSGLGPPNGRFESSAGADQRPEAKTVPGRSEAMPLTVPWRRAEWLPLPVAQPVPAAPLDAAALAELINEVLAEQARLHGVDL